MQGTGVAGVTWRKSSYSGWVNDCVELAVGVDNTAVRDSKNPASGVLSFGSSRWTEFLHTTKQIG
jgi:hypothetical protein